MHAGEAARVAGERGGERAAVAHRIAQGGHAARDAGVGRGFLHVAQGAVEVLAGAQHGGHLAHQVGDFLLAQAAPAAEVDVQQAGAAIRASAGSARIGVTPWRCRRSITSASLAASIRPRWTSPPGPIAM